MTFIYLSQSRPFPVDLCSDGSLITSEARDGRDAPPAAAPHAPQRCLSPRSAAYATPGSPEGDLPSVPLSDRTGDCPGHCHSHHGDLPNYKSYTGTGHKTVR